MRLKHGIQPACLRHLIYLQMEDARWVSPFKVDPPGFHARVMENWVSPVSLQQQGHWAFATLLSSRRSRNPSWNLPWEITSISCRGTGVCGLGASACQMHGSQVFRLDCCMSPEVDVTSSSFPVPDSVRGTQ